MSTQIVHVEGYCGSHFAPVREAFVRNFTAFSRLPLQCLAASLVALLASGCLMIPLPSRERAPFQETAKARVTGAAIQPGLTTRQQILERLGPSTIDLSDWNLLAYQFPPEKVRDMTILLLPVFAGGSLPDIRGEAREEWVLFVALDGDSVTHAELIKRSPLAAEFGTIRSLARAWAEKKGLMLPPEEIRFDRKAIPEGKGLIYVYRFRPWSWSTLQGGCPGPLVVTLHADVEYRPDLELKGHSYWTYTVEPREHWLRVARRSSLSFGNVAADVSITARAGEAVFVRIGCYRDGGAFRVAAEAVPEQTGTKELVGARLAW